MSDDQQLIHVQVGGNPTEGLMEQIGQQIRQIAPRDAEVVVTDDGVEIGEYPALDEYADELAERVAENIAEHID